jgi:hypothetical protein
VRPVSGAIQTPPNKREGYSVSDNTVEVKTEFPHLRRMIEQIAMEVALPENQTFDVGAFMDNILGAESAEEVFKAQILGSTATKDFTDRPFVVRDEDIWWATSTITETGAFPYYVMMKVIDTETQEEVTLNGGGSTFCAVVRRLQELDFFKQYPDGAPLMLLGKSTQKGNEVIMLKPLAAPPVAEKSARGKK